MKMEKVPTVTAQERRVRMVKVKPVFYDSPRIKSAKALLVAHLKQHRLSKPYDSGVRLRVSRLFPKGRHKDGEYRITKPKKASSPIGGIKTTSLPIKNTENHTFKGKFGVEKSGDSGIIKEENKKPITPITDKAIERVPKVDIDGYSEEQRVEIQKQHKKILKFSKEQNDNKEVAFAFREDLTDKQIFLGSDDKLDFGTTLGGMGRDLTVLHNHPRNSSFSDVDISLFKNLKSLKTLTIVKNNGDVEFITKGDNFNDEVFKLEYNRLKKKMVKNNTDAEYDKFISKLLNKTKSGVIWSEKNIP